jgi:hypothetical protein
LRTQTNRLPARIALEPDGRLPDSGKIAALEPERPDQWLTFVSRVNLLNPDLLSHKTGAAGKVYLLHATSWFASRWFEPNGAKAGRAVNRGAESAMLAGCWRVAGSLPR